MAQQANARIYHTSEGHQTSWIDLDSGRPGRRTAVTLHSVHMDGYSMAFKLIAVDCQRGQKRVPKPSLGYLGSWAQQKNI